MLVFPVLRTDRLLLRQLTADDIPALVRYADNRNVSKWVLNIPYPYREPDAVFRIGYVLKGFKEKNRFVFAIILKECDELAGEIGLHLDADPKTAQLGYWLGEPFWGRGLTSEAAKAITAFGFERLGLELIYAICHADNPASAGVLLKSGFTRHHENGAVVQYRLKKEDYDAIKA